MKYNKLLNLLLGVSLFTFGFLKVFDPFKSWYTVQISASGLGPFSYVMGIVGEMMVGVAFLSSLVWSRLLSFRNYAGLSIVASVMVIIMMATGTYVHLHPDVPEEVLPLNFKPPFLPLTFLAAALINIVLLLRLYKIKSMPSR